MKRLTGIIAALSLLFPVLCGCSVSKYREIRLSSFDIESFNLESSKVISIIALIGVDNPAPQLQLDTAFATVRAGGRDIVYLSTANVSVAAQKDSVYRVPVRGTLAPGINVLYVLGALKEGGGEAITADFDAKLVLRGGIGKTLEYRDVKLEKLKDIL